MTSGFRGSLFLTAHFGRFLGTSWRYDHDTWWLTGLILARATRASLVGGFKHGLRMTSISYIGWNNPSHRRTPSFFKMGTLHHQPVVLSGEVQLELQKSQLPSPVSSNLAPETPRNGGFFHGNINHNSGGFCITGLPRVMTPEGNQPTCMIPGVKNQS